MPRPTSASARRAQRRQTTYDEIITLARAALREGKPVSLRAIAAEMGMTAPALYRYVDSHAALQEALVEGIYDDVLVEMQAAADRYDPTQFAECMLAAIIAFRRWALRHPEEFRLVFAPITPGEHPVLRDDGSLPKAVQFGVYFMRQVAALNATGTLTFPADSDVPEHVREVYERRFQMWEGGDVPRMPLGLWWACLRDWVLLCGTISMEVCGQVAEELVASGALFREVTKATGQYLPAGQTTTDMDAVAAAEFAVD